MTLNRYTYDLSNDIQSDLSDEIMITLSVGNYAYVCDFQWSFVTEEQLNELDKGLAVRASSDPLVNGSSYNRTYDWLSFISPLINMSQEELEDWVKKQDWLPSSWKNKTSLQIYYLLQNEKDDIKEIIDYRQLLEESLNWQVTVKLGDDTIVTVVRLGGWNEFDTGHAFRFVAPGYTTIGKSELQYVTMEFDVNE